MATEDQQNSSKPDSNLDRAKLDLQKWQIEEDINLRRDELELKRRDLSKSRWSSPLLIAIVGLFTSIVLSIIQNSCQSSATQKLERQKFESALIQKALDSDSKEQDKNRFQSYIDLELIEDPAIKAKIERYIRDPKSIPLNTPAEDIFLGTERSAAKLSIGNEEVQIFEDLKALIDSLPSESTMTSRVPPITSDANSERVREEQRNVKVKGFLYAATKESSNDFRLVIGRDPNSQPEMFMLMSVAALPPSINPALPKLQLARNAFKDFFSESLPGQSYDFYDPPIPVEIEGSLYFDITHVEGVRPGPKSLKNRIPTLWWVHPITSIVFSK